MTREEITNSRVYQVTKAALEYYKEHHQDKDIDLTDAFKAGFEYADRTMIEKACEWLESTDIDMKYWNSEDGVCKELLIEDFKKAMES
jgi:hypothetical protein